MITRSILHHAGIVTLIATGANAGQLSFAPFVELNPGTGLVHVEGGDLDGDGDLDIVIASLGGSVTVLRNQGGAVFAGPVHYTSGSAHLDLALADLNGDGKPDVALPNFLGSNNLSVMLNQGDGTFGPSIDYPTTGVPNPRAIAAGDVDGDGDRDLVVGDAILTSKVVLLNNGAGVFSALPSFDSGGTCIQIALGDLDGDSDLDLVTVLAGAFIHRNNGNGTFTAGVSLRNQQGSAVAIANLDTDADLDIVVLFSTTEIHEAGVFVNDGTATSFAHTPYDIETLGRDIALADLDGDGRVDIATSHVSSVNRVDVLLNQGNALFAPRVNFFPGIYPQSLSLGDFDGDGRRDVITANQFANPPSVGFLRNTTPMPPTPFCFGDGTGSACPCGNDGALGDDAGCRHSQGQGARLTGAGSSSLALDTLVLSGSSMPNGPVLYFQGATAVANGAGSTFGDGLLCASGAITRMAIKFNSAGTSQLPAAGDATISTLGGITSPGTRIYQGWYRDSAPFCTPDSFNLTSACRVVWTQ